MDDCYAGDLDGAPCPQADSVRAGICLDGKGVGIDLLDKNGRTVMHAHFDAETALAFIESLSDALEKLIGSAHPLPHQGE